MNCPHCAETVLLMTHRQGVEIDYCPQCRGVWLDRGELDKLLERAADVAQAAPVVPSMRDMRAVPPEPSGYRGDGRDGYRGDGRDGYRGDGRDGYARTDAGYRKKKSWLNEIFD